MKIDVTFRNVTMKEIDFVRNILHQMEDSKKPSQNEVSQLKKMIIVSPETHSSLFLIKGNIQSEDGKNITLDEVMKILIEEYNLKYKTARVMAKMFKLEEKE